MGLSLKYHGKRVEVHGSLQGQGPSQKNKRTNRGKKIGVMVVVCLCASGNSATLKVHKAPPTTPNFFFFETRRAGVARAQKSPSFVSAIPSPKLQQECVCTWERNNKAE